MNRPDGIESRQPQNVSPAEVTGDFVEWEQESCYRISDVQRMPEFFMSLTSASDHWMFLSSEGALSAGRRDSDHVLFPYYSQDKISDLRHCTGPLTIIRVTRDQATQLWEPFAWKPAADFQRNLYKNSLGNRVIFEEINTKLNLIFRYSWSFSHRFGFVRKCRVENFGNTACQIELLDGIQNLMTYGIGENFQQRFSNLGDAYKKNELLEDAGIGLFYLSSIPTDRAEPSEGLRATTVWSSPAPQTILLSGAQIEPFRNGVPVSTEYDIRGQRSAYLAIKNFELAPQQQQNWSLIAEIGMDQTDVANLRQTIQSTEVIPLIEDDVSDGDRRLKNLMRGADAFQSGGIPARNQRHLSNVIFNVMRGGVPKSDYLVHRHDFMDHVKQVNHQLADQHRDLLSELPEILSRAQLLEQIGKANDSHLLRIAREYLPLVFSRRHGDPSRPWNKFSIKSHVGDDTNAFDYQGNWRDIFQNWEAMAMSYPEYPGKHGLPLSELLHGRWLQPVSSHQDGIRMGSS